MTGSERELRHSLTLAPLSGDPDIEAEVLTALDKENYLVEKKRLLTSIVQDQLLIEFRAQGGRSLFSRDQINRDRKKLEELKDKGLISPPTYKTKLDEYDLQEHFTLIDQYQKDRRLTRFIQYGGAAVVIPSIGFILNYFTNNTYPEYAVISSVTSIGGGCFTMLGYCFSKFSIHKFYSKEVNKRLEKMIDEVEKPINELPVNHEVLDDLEPSPV